MVDDLDRSEPHPVNQLNGIANQQFRFGIMALLSSADSDDFTTLRDTLDVTGGDLNRHLAVPADHDFVTIDITRHR